MSNTRVFRTLELRARAVPIRHSGLHAQLRTAKFEQRDHLVVPVIGLVEGVLHAVNAPEPELVLASEFGISPGGWGGRPVTWDHPSMNGERVMANEPRTLERYAVGQVFNPRIGDDGKQLLLEAWLDSFKETIPEARTLRDRLKTNETVEVSVGVFCTAEKAEGTYNGRPYKAIWRDIVPDHLAMLPRGATGACSVEDGCGAPRTARKSFIITAAGGYDEAPQETSTVTKCTKCGTEHEGDCVENRTLRQRLSALLFAGKKKPEDLTSKNLHSDLELVLRSSEPGFLGVDDVNLTTSEVMYSVAPDPDVVQHYQRGYTVGEDNTVSLANKKTEVAPVLRWEPVVAEGQPREACGCGGGAQHEGEPMSKIATDRVKALIAKKTNAFTDADTSFLEGMSEDRFKALETFEPEKETVEKVVEKEVVKEVPAAPKTEEEYLATAPESIRNIVSDHKAAQAAKRTAAVSRLKTAQSAFSEADLNAMPIDQLLKLDQAIPRQRGEVVDFSVRTAGEHRDDSTIEAPPSLTEAVGKARTAAGLK